MRQRRYVLVAKHHDAVFVHGALVRLPGPFVRLLGVLQSSPGELLPGLVILLLMCFGGAAMSMGGKVVHFRGSLMVLVMRSVVVTCGHFRGSQFPRTYYGCPSRVCKPDPSSAALVPNAR